jgi:succinate dehydrogenase / fumarate reductase flavoprotein subunit
MSNIPGLFVAGEANFSDHGANRLGASALMQGLADGYFVLPYTVGGYIASSEIGGLDTDAPEFVDAENAVRERTDKLLSINGSRTVDDFHKQLGRIIWDECGMSRTEQGLKRALQKIPEVREEFWQNVSVVGSSKDFNQVLERAARVADFLEFGELMCRDALTRNESCGGHFREEHQYESGEARRDDENYRHVAAWRYEGQDQEPSRHIEPLDFEEVKLTQRSYK